MAKHPLLVLLMDSNFGFLVRYRKLCVGTFLDRNMLELNFKIKIKSPNFSYEKELNIVQDLSLSEKNVLLRLIFVVEVNRGGRQIVSTLVVI